MGVKILDNFFSNEVINELDIFIKKNITTRSKNTDIPIFSTSFHTWDKNLINFSTPILRYYLNDLDSALVKKIKKEIESKINFYVDGITIHVFPKLSYIPWHTDGIHKAALTVYLNDNWNDNWGGYFLYESTNSINAIKPKKNKAILQSEGVNHCVTTLNMDSDLRITLQVFLQKEKKLL